MQITETMLLDGYNGLSNGLDYISTVRGQRIFWQYRCDGTVCEPDDAEEITLTYDRVATLSLDDSHADHPATEAITEALHEVYGAEIA